MCIISINIAATIRLTIKMVFDHENQLLDEVGLEFWRDASGVGRGPLEDLASSSAGRIASALRPFLSHQEIP
jgi:hypothetical protein